MNDDIFDFLDKEDILLEAQENLPSSMNLQGEEWRVVSIAPNNWIRLKSKDNYKFHIRGDEEGKDGSTGFDILRNPSLVKIPNVNEILKRFNPGAIINIEGGKGSYIFKTNILKSDTIITYYDDVSVEPPVHYTIDYRGISSSEETKAEPQEEPQVTPIEKPKPQKLPSFKKGVTSQDLVQKEIKERRFRRINIEKIYFALGEKDIFNNFNFDKTYIDSIKDIYTNCAKVTINNDDIIEALKGGKGQALPDLKGDEFLSKDSSVMDYYYERKNIFENYLTKLGGSEKEIVQNYNILPAVTIDEEIKNFLFKNKKGSRTPNEIKIKVQEPHRNDITVDKEVPAEVAKKIAFRTIPGLTKVPGVEKTPEEINKIENFSDDQISDVLKLYFHLGDSKYFKDHLGEKIGPVISRMYGNPPANINLNRSFKTHLKGVLDLSEERRPLSAVDVNFIIKYYNLPDISNNINYLKYGDETVQNRYNEFWGNYESEKKKLEDKIKGTEKVENPQKLFDITEDSYRDIMAIYFGLAAEKYFIQHGNENEDIDEVIRKKFIEKRFSKLEYEIKNNRRFINDSISKREEQIQTLKGELNRFGERPSTEKGADIAYKHIDKQIQDLEKSIKTFQKMNADAEKKYTEDKGNIESITTGQIENLRKTNNLPDLNGEEIKNGDEEAVKAFENGKIDFINFKKALEGEVIKNAQKERASMETEIGRYKNDIKTALMSEDANQITNLLKKLYVEGANITNHARGIKRDKEYETVDEVVESNSKVVNSLSLQKGMSEFRPICVKHNEKYILIFNKMELGAYPGQESARKINVRERNKWFYRTADLDEYTPVQKSNTQEGRTILRKIVDALTGERVAGIGELVVNELEELQIGQTVYYKGAPYHIKEIDNVKGLVQLDNEEPIAPDKGPYKWVNASEPWRQRSYYAFENMIKKEKELGEPIFDIIDSDSLRLEYKDNTEALSYFAGKNSFDAKKYVQNKADEMNATAKNDNQLRLNLLNQWGVTIPIIGIQKNEQTVHFFRKSSSLKKDWMISGEILASLGPEMYDKKQVSTKLLQFYIDAAREVVKLRFKPMSPSQELSLSDNESELRKKQKTIFIDAFNKLPNEAKPLIDERWITMPENSKEYEEGAQKFINKNKNWYPIDTKDPLFAEIEKFYNSKFIIDSGMTEEEKREIMMKEEKKKKYPVRLYNAVEFWRGSKGGVKRTGIRNSPITEVFLFNSKAPLESKREDLTNPELEFGTDVKENLTLFIGQVERLKNDIIANKYTKRKKEEWNRYRKDYISGWGRIKRQIIELEKNKDADPKLIKEINDLDRKLHGNIELVIKWLTALASSKVPLVSKDLVFKKAEEGAEKAPSGEKESEERVGDIIYNEVKGFIDDSNGSIKKYKEFLEDKQEKEDEYSTSGEEIADEMLGGEEKDIEDVKGVRNIYKELRKILAIAENYEVSLRDSSISPTDNIFEKLADVINSSSDLIDNMESVYGQEELLGGEKEVSREDLKAVRQLNKGQKVYYNGEPHFIFQINADSGIVQLDNDKGKWVRATDASTTQFTYKKQEKAGEKSYQSGVVDHIGKIFDLFDLMKWTVKTPLFSVSRPIIACFNRKGYKADDIYYLIIKRAGRWFYKPITQISPKLSEVLPLSEQELKKILMNARKEQKEEEEESDIKEESTFYSLFNSLKILLEAGRPKGSKNKKKSKASIHKEFMKDIDVARTLERSDRVWYNNIGYNIMDIDSDKGLIKIEPDHWVPASELTLKHTTVGFESKVDYEAEKRKSQTEANYNEFPPALNVEKGMLEELYKNMFEYESKNNKVDPRQFMINFIRIVPLKESVSDDIKLTFNDLVYFLDLD
jgi:hypothetical protein